MAALARRDKAVKSVVHFISGWGGVGEGNEILCNTNVFLFGNLMFFCYYSRSLGLKCH